MAAATIVSRFKLAPSAALVPALAFVIGMPARVSGARSTADRAYCQRELFKEFLAVCKSADQ